MLSKDGGALFVGTSNGTLQAVGAADGAARWQYIAGTAAISASPAVSHDGRAVFFTASDGFVFAVYATEWQ